MTTPGDVITGGVGGTPERLAIGAAGTLLGPASGALDYATLETLTGIGSVVSATLAANLALVASTPTEVLSVALGAGTWLVLGQTAIDSPSAAGGGADICLGPTSASFAGAYSVMTTAIGNVTGSTALPGYPVSAIVTLAGALTVFLNAVDSLAGTVQVGGIVTGVGPVTTLTAVRLA